MKIKHIAFIPLFFALSGCLSLQSTQAPPATYMLHPDFSAIVEPKYKTAVFVSIQKPLVPPGFETDQIALYFANGRRLDYFANARWPDSFDRMLQDFTIDSARRAFPDLIVGSPDLSIPAAYRLNIKVNDFQPVYAQDPDHTPELFVSLTYTVVALPEEKVRADFTLSAQGKSAGNDLTSITSGLEALLRSTTAEALQKISPILTQNQ